MADMCSKCNSSLADYVGDMSEILFEVKVGKPKKFIELPSKETPGYDDQLYGAQSAAKPSPPIVGIGRAAAPQM